MEFTLRGDGMLGIWVDGASVSNTWGEGSFAEKVEYRLGNRSNPTAFNNGFFFSFTHPFGDYEDQSTYTLKINEMDSDIMLEIIAVEERVGQATRPIEPDTEQGEVVDAYDIMQSGTYYPYSSGQDFETGFTWDVQLLNFQDSW